MYYFFAFLVIFNSLFCNEQISPTFPEQFEKFIKYDSQGTNTIGLINIDKKDAEISQATWIYVKKALDYYKEHKPIFIILRLNTPGGEVFAAEKISDALREMDIQLNIPCVAFIDNWAMSAGALLAYSCRFIAATTDASMGAAEPIVIGEGGQMTTASEKINSAIRTDFANRANFFGRNPYIAMAMVDKDIILVWRNGKILKLDAEDQIKKTDPRDIIINAKGKLLTLQSEDLLKFGVANVLVPIVKLEPLNDQEKETGKWPADKLSLFHSDYFSKIPNAVIDEYKMDWKTHFFVFLANPVVSSILFMALMVGLYMEFSSPGVGLPAIVALTSLLLIILSSFALEIGSFLELILMAVGVLIIVLDLFLLPTFGLIGIIGVILFLIGLVSLMLPGMGQVNYEFDTQTFNAAGEAFISRLAWISGTFVLTLIIMALLSRFIRPSFGAFRRFVLNGNEQLAEKGYIAGELPSTLPQPGSTGEAFTTLRPAGKIIINDRIYDAVSQGDFIEKGSKIHIVKLDGSVIMVDSLEDSEI